MKKAIPLMLFIFLLAACNEPKMKLRAPEPKEQTKETAAETPDTVKKDTTILAVKD